MKIEDQQNKQTPCLSEGRIADLERNSATLHQIAALLCNDWLHEKENIVVGISRLLAKLRSYQQEEAWNKYEEVLEEAARWEAVALREAREGYGIKFNK